MIRKLRSLSRKTLLLLAAIVVIGGGAFFKFGGNTKTPDYPRYFNFSGNYVFAVPKDYSVDEQSVPGAQLVYTGTITARTVEDVFNSNGIAVQEIAALTDHSTKGFKDYVNNTFLPDIKKNLSTEDVKVRFGKKNGVDNAQATVKKDGKVVRYVYLKGGQHPAQIVAKSQTDQVKTIVNTVIDVENSLVKDEAAPVKQSLENVAKLVKEKKAADIYNGSTQTLKSISTEEQLGEALEKSKPFIDGNVVISGGSFVSADEFTMAIRFTEINKENPVPAYGSMVLKKVDGQWKLELLSLPDPTSTDT